MNETRIADFPIGTLVRKGHGKVVYRVYRHSSMQVAVCKATTVKDPSNGGWCYVSELTKVEDAS